MPRALVYTLWIAGCLTLMVASCDSPNRSSSGVWDLLRPTEEERVATMAWDFIPDPPRPKLGRMVRTPRPPAYNRSLLLGMPAVGTAEHEVLHDRLDLMLTHHPDPEIRGEFAKLMANDDVVLEEAWWTPLDTAVQAAFYVGIYEDGMEKPTVIVNFWHVAAMRNRYDVALGMLWVTHEHAHFKQWRNSTGIERTYFMATVDIPCRPHWKMEQAAYMDTCEASYTYGWADFNPADRLCRRYTKKSAFDQSLLIHMVSTGYIERSPECIRDWPMAAGHPNPEAFKPMMTAVAAAKLAFTKPSTDESTDIVPWAIHH